MIVLRPTRLFALQCAIIVALALGHAAGMPLLASTNETVVKFFHQYLDLNAEGTPAAYFSALGFLATALVAWYLRREAKEGRERRFWTLTALLLAFFSLDEAASIHEGFVVVGRQFVPQEGIFYFTWWAPYLLLLAPVLLVLLPGLMRLPARTRRGLIAAGCLFLAGALGLELIESKVADQITAAPGAAETLRLRFQFAWLTLVEECLEMVAVALALLTLLRHAAAFAPDAAIRVADRLERPHVAS